MALWVRGYSFEIGEHASLSRLCGWNAALVASEAAQGRRPLYWLLALG